MSNTITKEELEKLCESKFWDSDDEFHDILEQITGITAKPYKGYSYFDASGNFIGDSNDVTIRDLLDNAYIKVVEKGGVQE
jgi:hypothetical protein